MPFVTPTDLWDQSPRRLIVPDLGTVDYPRGGAIAVDEGIAAWLLEEGYVTEAEPPQTIAVKTPPEPNEQEQEQERDSGETQTPELEEWQTKTLEFLNSTPSEEVAKQIKGIGNKTAEDLAKACPLDWNKLNEILNSSQINALKHHFS
jgi:hypothetical protein